MRIRLLLATALLAVMLAFFGAGNTVEARTQPRCDDCVGWVTP